jgi:hypothetical protein
MRRWWIRLLILLAVGVGPAMGEVLNLDAMLILASNDPAPLDRRLERVEFQLRPLFRFEYYRFLGSGSGAVNVPGETSVALGDGHYLQLKAREKDGGKRVEVRWFRGDQPILSTAVNLRKGKPVILGGAPQGTGKLIVTLTAR